MFIIDVSATLVTLVLNLDKVGVNNKAKHFENVPNDLVGGNAANQRNSVSSLEVSHLLVICCANHF